MACPTEDFQNIKKLARFLIGVETVKWQYEWQDEREALKIQAFADSDWAGCRESRRSTSGGVLLLGKHPLRTWSATQPVMATSSCEAELYSLTEAMSRGLGLQSMLREIALSVFLVACTDS